MKWNNGVQLPTARAYFRGISLNNNVFLIGKKMIWTIGPTVPFFLSSFIEHSLLLIHFQDLKLLKLSFNPISRRGGGR